MGPKEEGLSGREIPKQVHSAVRELHGRWPAEYKQSQSLCVSWLEYFKYGSSIYPTVFLVSYSLALTVQVLTGSTV